MPPKTKTAAEKQQLKKLIIDAARDLFVTKGVEAVSMREIAKGIGYSATSIYSHFKDKEAILRAIVDTDFQELATRQESILAISDPVERLQTLGRGYAEFALNYPNHYRMMFMMPRPMSCQDGTTEKGSAEQATYDQLLNAVIAVHETGAVKDGLDDPELVAQTIWAGIHGVCSLEIILADDQWVHWASIEQRIEMMIGMIGAGLMKEPQ